jgi:hypothetical protein
MIATGLRISSPTSSRRPALGHSATAGSDPELVGRTSAPASGRALVPTAPGSPTAEVGPRPRGTFVAHLIATATDAPQTRARRRAEPDEAISVYAAAAGEPGRVGLLLRRSL